MTTTITLQLPDEFAQRLQAEAQQQNTTLENLVTQRLMQNTTAASMGELGEFGGEGTPSIKSLEDFFNAIRNARKAKQATVQAPASEPFVEMAESLKRTGILLDVQTVDQRMTLQINPTPPIASSLLPSIEIDTSKLDSEAVRIVKALENEDGNVRFQAIQDLLQWYKRQAA